MLIEIKGDVILIERRRLGFLYIKGRPLVASAPNVYV